MTTKTLMCVCSLFLLLFYTSDKALHGSEKVRSQEQRAKTGLGQKRHFMRTLFLTACVNQGLQPAVILLAASKPRN